MRTSYCERVGKVWVSVTTYMWDIGIVLLGYYHCTTTILLRYYYLLWCELLVILICVCVVLLSELFINDCVWQSVRCVWQTVVCYYWNRLSICDYTTNLFMYAITMCVITVWVSITITTNELSTNFVVWADELTNCRFVKPSGVIYQNHWGGVFAIGGVGETIACRLWNRWWSFIKAIGTTD